MAAKYLPLNAVEHDNMLRTIIMSHMGTHQGNPTNWVVTAVHEAFQRGFGIGFDSGLAAARTPPPPPPAFRVQIDAPAPPTRPERQPRLLPGAGDVIDA